MMWLLRLLRIETTQVLPSSGATPVVHLTGRNYPGVVIEGDVLWMLRRDIDELVQNLEGSQEAGRSIVEARGLQKKIHGIFNDYNQTCREYGRGGFEEGQPPW